MEEEDISFWQGRITESLFPNNYMKESNGFYEFEVCQPNRAYYVKAQITNWKMNGTTQIYNQKKTLVAELTFRDGIANGPCKLFYSNKKLYFEGTLEDGYRQWKGTEYDKSGNVVSDGYYIQGVLKNIVQSEEMPDYYKEYTSEHKLISITQRDNHGRKNGLCYFYDDNQEISRISIWKNDKEIGTEGDCKLFDEPQEVWYEGHFKNGLRQGRGRETDIKSGKIIFDGFYDQGKRIKSIITLQESRGFWKEYDTEGNLINISQRDDYGRKHGICYFYNKEGNIIKISEWIEGKEKGFMGICKIFDEPRQVWYEGHFENGNRHYKGMEYDTEGNILFDGFYENGQRIKNIIPLEENPGYWKEYDKDNDQLISISQRDEYMRKNGICYSYDENQEISRISIWKYDKEIETTGYCEIYDEPQGKWYRGHFENGKKLNLTPLPNKKGYWIETNNKNQVIYICGRDKDEKNDGICYLFSNEEIQRISLWEHGTEMKLIKQFNGTSMIEYNDDGQKCYEGEYLKVDDLNYLRNGRGEEYGADGKTLLFKGSYDKDRRHGKGILYRNNKIYRKSIWLAGYSVQGLLLTLLCLAATIIALSFIDVVLGVAGALLLAFLILIRWCLPMLLGKTLCSRTDLQLMADYIRTNNERNARAGKSRRSILSGFYENAYMSAFVVTTLATLLFALWAYLYYNSANAYVHIFQTTYTVNSFENNHIFAFRLRFKPFLQAIEIKEQCFAVASEFNIKGLNSLHSVKIGPNSFTEAINRFGNDGSKSFYILNCDNLQSIEIGEYSFSDYGGEFEIRNLPALQSLEIGGVDKSSLNFYSVKSFTAESTPITWLAH